MFNHPKNVCMTYFEHMRFSLYLSYNLFKDSIASLIHAIYYDILITYTSDLLLSLIQEMENIGCR